MAIRLWPVFLEPALPCTSCVIGMERSPPSRTFLRCYYVPSSCRPHLPSTWVSYARRRTASMQCNRQCNARTRKMSNLSSSTTFFFAILFRKYIFFHHYLLLDSGPLVPGERAINFLKAIGILQRLWTLSGFFILLQLRCPWCRVL